MSVARSRYELCRAAKQWSAFQDDQSLALLERAAEHFGYEKKHARSRREKWKERRITKVGDGLNRCRIDGCREAPTMRPVLLFPAMDGGKEPIKMETALLDVCEVHARTVGPDAFVENPSIWDLMRRVWTDHNLPEPDKRLVEVEYHRI
jgi:hypothetical protein